MELRHLRYFIAVGEALSFTKAALKLRLAQPSLTRQIQNLEAEIGVTLIDRSHNRVELTEEGRRFLFDSKKLLALTDEMVSAVQLMSKAESSQLNIGYVANLHYELLPATLGGFRKLHPRVALNLFDMTSAEQFRALGGRKIDIGFVPAGGNGLKDRGTDSRKIDLGYVGLSPDFSDQNLLAECVAYDTIMIALPERHPLARKPEIELADVKALFFVSMSTKTHPGEYTWLVEICERAGFVAQILQEVDTEPMAIKFVADGLGVALLPLQITALPHDGVIFRQFAPVLRRQSFIAWHAENPSRPLQDYIKIVKDLTLSAGSLGGSLEHLSRRPAAIPRLAAIAQRRPNKAGRVLRIAGS